MNTDPIRVLLVDDERSFREPLARFVESEFINIELVTAGGFQEAIRLVHARPRNYFHVSVIDDVLVPEVEGGPSSGSGLDLMAEIQQHSPQTEHIIYTGWGTKRGLEALRAGAYHLSKSAPRDELILHIQAAAEKGRLKVTAYEKQLLEQLLKSSTALLSDGSREEVLATILHCVQTIGYDRVRLYWISEDGRWLEGVAQVGPDPVPAFVGSRREVEKDYYLQRLLANPYPQLFNRGDDIPAAARPVQVTGDVEEWACVPLLLEGQVVGKLSVDNKSGGRPIIPETFDPLMLFATQAAAAIVTAQLRADRQQAAEQAGQRADKLETVQRLANVINTTLDIEEIARTACQAAVELFDVDHSGFLYADPDLVAGSVLAEYPDLGLRRQRVPLKGIPREEEMIRTRQPVIINDVASDRALGEVGQILARYDIRSILLAPVVYRDRLYGSFSLDLIGRQRAYTQELVELCRIVADQLAVAFHNAELFRRFERLRETSLAVTAELDRSVLLDTIIKQAAELLQARKGGIYEYFPEQHELRIVADFGHVDVKGRVVKEGEGMAGRLVTGPEDHLIVNDYHHSPYQAAIFKNEQPFGAVIEVKLKWQGQTKGVLYLDDDVGRQFSDDDAYLLRLFADQASIALAHADVVRNLKRRTRLLDSLNLITREILSEDEPQKLLHQVVRRAAELSGCEYAGLLIHYDNLVELELQVVHGFSAAVIGTRLGYEESILGAVAVESKPVFIRNLEQRQQEAEFLRQAGLKVITAAPLKAAGKVEAVLFVADPDGDHPFNEDDLDVLERFASAAAVALQRAQALHDDQRGFARLKLLHSISDFMQKSQDLEQIFHVFLTGITAGYGLGFNRAALFLLDEGKTHLEGKMGIGHYTIDLAREAWKKDQVLKTDNIESYLRRLKAGLLPPTPIGDQIRALPPLLLEDPENDLFASVVRDNQFQPLSDENLSRLPEPFRLAFEPSPPGIVLTLRARGEVIGLVIADNKFTRVPVARNDIDSLLAFAETAAAAIDSVSLLRQTEEARERLGTFFEASNDLVLTEQTEAVLNLAVARVCQAAEAQAASLIIMDESRRVQDHFSIGLGKITDVEELARPGGLSAQIMDSQRPLPAENCDSMRVLINPSAIWQPVKAALGLPLVLEGKAIGVLWVHYRKPRRFPQGWIDALQLYANHAAIVYDNVRRITELTALRQVTEELAGATEPEEVLKSIVKNACQVLKARSACLYPIDSVRQQLVREKSAFYGIPDKLISELKKDIALQPDGTTATVFEKGWLPVEDISDEQRYGFIGQNTRSLLNKMGAGSFQGIAVKTGEKPLGVLYVNFDRRRFFGVMERQTAEAFANQAAAALENANLASQIRQARLLAGEVARVTALGDLNATLQSVADYTKMATDSDAVVVYAYDRVSRRLSHKPAICGVNIPDGVSSLPEVEKSSLVWKMLKRRSIYIAPDTARDRHFKDSRFTRDEEVKTAVAVPLRYGDREVGVMFVNYRQPHQLGKQEKDDIQLFANQAAVAIYNVQTYERLKQSIEEMKRQEALIRSRTTTAWVGMMSSTWTHRMNTRLSTVSLAIKNIRHELAEEPLATISPRLDAIERLVEDLLQRPVVPDLARVELASVCVNAHLHDRMKTLWEGEPYRSIELVLGDAMQPETAIRADPFWLREAYDIVIDNAIEAMEKTPAKRLAVVTRASAEGVEICFRDTGCGIPEAFLPLLFQSQVPKMPDSKGWGTGLLLAQLIVETFGGSIGVGHTDSSGTEMILRFPEESMLSRPERGTGLEDGQ